MFSIKLVGLFVTALVGVYTIEDLWTKLGDLRLSYKDQAKHWAARVACLIVLPLVVYMAAFKIHFIILNHSGPGDAQMSSLFQANLVGNTFGENPLGASSAQLVAKRGGLIGGPQRSLLARRSRSRTTVTAAVYSTRTCRRTLKARISSR
jgi:dolichyl-phosphate-mannose-protein mannosyltransferase